jgi:AcrR family transcriptional regulator
VTILAASSIFGAGDVLPRGPHRLSRDEVAASQRTRLMAATAAVVAEVGFTKATIAQITKVAGVSPRAFYEHFTGKEECYLAAYDTFAASLLGRVGADLPPEADWQAFLAGALTAYLRSLEDDPITARAFLIEIESAGPRARKRRHEAYAAFAALLRERHEAIRAQDPSLGPLPERLYLAITHGVRAIVCHELDTSAEPQLITLTDDLLLWITATFAGAATAREQLGASG